MNDIKQVTKWTEEVRFILTEMLRSLDEAQVDADDTTWDNEKVEALNKGLTAVEIRCGYLAYDLRVAGYNQTLLNKKEQDRLARLLSDD